MKRRPLLSSSRLRVVTVACASALYVAFPIKAGSTAFVLSTDVLALINFWLGHLSGAEHSKQHHQCLKEMLSVSHRHVGTKNNICTDLRESRSMAWYLQNKNLYMNTISITHSEWNKWDPWWLGSQCRSFSPDTAGYIAHKSMRAACTCRQPIRSVVYTHVLNTRQRRAARAGSYCLSKTTRPPVTSGLFRAHIQTPFSLSKAKKIALLRRWSLERVMPAKAPSMIHWP
jgi:hypothetical protein